MNIIKYCEKDEILFKCNLNNSIKFNFNDILNEF